MARLESLKRFTVTDTRPSDKVLYLLDVSPRCKLFIFHVIDVQNLRPRQGARHEGEVVTEVFVHRWIRAPHPPFYRDRNRTWGQPRGFRFERADANRTGKYFALRGSRAVKCTGTDFFGLFLSFLLPLLLSLCGGTRMRIQDESVLHGVSNI